MMMMMPREMNSEEKGGSWSSIKSIGNTCICLCVSILINVRVYNLAKVFADRRWHLQNIYINMCMSLFMVHFYRTCKGKQCQTTNAKQQKKNNVLIELLKPFNTANAHSKTISTGKRHPFMYITNKNASTTNRQPMCRQQCVASAFIQ